MSARLIGVELTRLRWRRAVLALVAIAVLVPTALIGFRIYETRPVTADDRAEILRTFSDEVSNCLERPKQYTLPRGSERAACERVIIEWYGQRSTLALTDERGGSGFAVTALLIVCLVLVGTTFAGHDWNTGSMSNQLLFEPRRLRVWASKATAVALLSVGMIRAWVPNLAPPPGASPLRELGALRRKQVWLTLGIAAIGFGGMFSVFSYVKPTLLQVAGMPLGWMPVVLSLFGVGMVGGNLIGSRLADKALMPTIGGLLIWSAAIQLLYVLTCHHPVAAALTVVLVGSAVAIGPALQIRLMDVAGDAQALAAALNHSAFNLANALGAWLGGLAIDAGLGYPSTGWVGTLLSLGGFGVFWWARQDARRRRPAPR